jgi:hypothetical protein
LIVALSVSRAIARKQGKISGVADLKYESSFMRFLKARLKLTFGYVQN